MHEITIVLDKNEDIDDLGWQFMEKAQHHSDFPSAVMESTTIKVIVLSGPWDHAMRLLNMQADMNVENIVSIYVNESDD